MCALPFASPTLCVFIPSRASDPGVVIVDEAAATVGGGASYSSYGGAASSRVVGGANYAAGARYASSGSPFVSGVTVGGASTPVQTIAKLFFMPFPLFSFRLIRLSQLFALVFSGGITTGSYGSAMAGYPISSRVSNYTGGRALLNVCSLVWC